MKPALCCALLGLAAIHAPVAWAEGPPNTPAGLQCQTEPLTKVYGGTRWIAYSCSDKQTVVLVAAGGNPAAPYYFTLYPKDGQYRLSGEGTGSKEASTAAAKEITALSPAMIKALIIETQVPIAQRPVILPPSNCQESLPITAANLTGTWRSKQDAAIVVTRYYQDGSFSGRIVTQDNKILWLFSGTWKLDGSILKTAYTFSTLERAPAGTTDADQILRIGCGLVTSRSLKSGNVTQERLFKDSTGP